MIGALNVAEMPPAAPQATMIRSRLSGSRTHWPTLEANAEPICTTLTCQRIRPPPSATATITSGTPCPRASLAQL